MIDKAQLAAARALREIRERKLWRKASASWRDYCRDHLPFDVRRANQLIRWLRFLEEEWEPGFPSPPLNEKQARPLYPLSPEERDHVAQRVDEDSGGVGFKGVSAGRVRKIAEEVSGSVGRRSSRSTGEGPRPGHRRPRRPPGQERGPRPAAPRRRSPRRRPR